MADTFVWGIAQLERKISDGIVYTAHWTATATREVTDSGTFTASTYGSVGFGDPDPDNFTPYDQLTEGQVVGWVLAALGDEQVESICSKLVEQLDAQSNPVDASGIPW